MFYLFIYLFLKIIKEVSSEIYFTATYCVTKATKVGKEELMDEIKFSHCITNELFRNTSWGIVDTISDFTTTKLISHS